MARYTSTGPVSKDRAWPGAVAGLVLLASTSPTACGGQLDLGDNDDQYSETGGDQDGTVPWTMARNQGPIHAIASDGTRVFWAAEVLWDGDAVIRGCDPSNCRATLVSYAAHQGEVNAMAADSSAVYWSNGMAGFLRSCSTSGCDGRPAEIALANVEGGFGKDGSHLYWFERDGTIQRCSFQGCGSAPEIVAVLDAVPQGLAVGELDVYVSTRATQTGKGQVLAVSKTGTGAPTVMASNQPTPGLIVADGQRVYWTAGLEGVFACPIPGGATQPTRVVSGVQCPWNLIVDRENLYCWTGDNNELVGSTSSMLIESSLSGSSGSTPKQLASGELTGPRLVATETHLFWTHRRDPSGEDEILGIHK